MMASHYTVRTLYLTNFFQAANEMAKLRRNPTNMQALVSAMKRVEMSDKTLQDELNDIAAKGYTLQTALIHPTQDKNSLDLLITAIFSDNYSEETD